MGNLFHNHSFLILFCVYLLAGCSTVVNSHLQKEDMMAAYERGDNAAVLDEINYKLREPAWYNTSVVNTGDEVMWRLEAGTMNFHYGKFAETVEQLSIAERLIREYDDRALLSARDVGAEAGAALTNMNALPYRGFCRDRIALSIYKALAYLGMNREQSFRAQLRRLRYEQKMVQEKYREFFEAEKAELQQARAQNQKVVFEKNTDISAEELAKNPKNADFAKSLEEMKAVSHRGYGHFLNPAATFLSGLGSMRDGRFDNARIDFKRLYEAMPQNDMLRRYYVSALQKAKRPIPAELQGVPPFEFPLERDCVYVIFANGRGAAFRQISIYFPVMTAWPVCEFYPAYFKQLQAVADSQTYRSGSLADMDAIIAQEFDERLPGIVTRIVLSTAIKEAAYYAALAAASQISDARARAIVMVSVAAAGAAYRIAANTADTRSWELLPKEFQLTQFPMPKNRNVGLTLFGEKNKNLSVTIPDNARSAIIFVSAPNAKNVSCHIFPMCSDDEKYTPSAAEKQMFSEAYGSSETADNSTQSKANTLTADADAPPVGSAASDL